jgi:predicted phosphodiesterase/2'-5' RNA ligase
MNANGDVVLLHLSDLHRSATADLSNADLFGSLWNDITHGYSRTNEILDTDEPRLPAIGEIDLIVVSGDLTNTATRQEFVEVEDLLGRLCQAFVGGDRSRVVVVPGNHDVDWALSAASYVELPSPTTDHIRKAQQHDSSYRLFQRAPLQTAVMQRERCDLHDERFREYGAFLQRFYGGAHLFPLDKREDQFTIFDSFTRDLGIVIVGFSSCDLVDHLWHRGTIHREAIMNASREIERRDYGPVPPLRIAVWHHNILGNPDQMDFMDPRTAILLGHHGFSLGLHGHVHAAGQMEMMGADAGLCVVWAGSLAAGHHQRPQSTPMLYNVIGIRPESREGWVHTRSRHDEHAAWRSYSVWTSRNRCWYPITLGSRPAQTVYSNIGHMNFLNEVAHFIEQSSEITFVGTGLNVLFQRQLGELIVNRAREGKLKATICFGNPFAPHVRERLVEEERGTVPPEVAATGIINRVRSLLQLARDVPSVQVKLFNNYPTMSIFRFNNGEYVFYPMGYRQLGNLCPVMSLRRPSLYAGFLDQMIDSYIEDAADAREVFRIRVEKQTTKDFVNSDHIRAVALYALPDPMSRFHDLGCNLLGYDATRGRLIEPADDETREFRKYVGPAVNYGFHVTVLDLMYVEASQITQLLSELREIGTYVRPFDLGIRAISEAYSPPWSLELLTSEESGELEKLETEVTVRILPVSLGTNYTLDELRSSHVRELSRRARTFCETYQAPHVLTEYSPHFTLAAPGIIPAPEVQERLRATVRTRFEPFLSGRHCVGIDRLYFLMKPLDAPMWDPIRDEHIIRLKR